MELIKLHNLLTKAFELVESEKTFKALHKLNEIVALLEDVKDDYSDVRTMYDNLLDISKLYWRRNLRKALALSVLNNAILICDEWIECKRRAS